MFLQLPNGRTIELSVEQYLELSEQDIQYLISCGNEYTFDTSNPFHKKFSYRTNSDKERENYDNRKNYDDEENT